MSIAQVDGRRARRERGREQVIDAVFALVQEGHYAPATDVIVERSGVSASSVFRYFDSVDDLLEQTIARYFEHFAPLVEIPSIGEGALVDRIAGFVDARLDLYEAIAPIARLARAGALDNETLASTLHDARGLFAAQAAEQFAPERAGLSSARSDDLVDLVSSLISFEAWDLLAVGHLRSRRQIRRAWGQGLTALLNVPASS